jgi:uncharacterized protein (TIGR00730 family)
MKSKKIITVFGSSRTRKNTKAYAEAYQLGKLIAEAGFVLCNGGYGGTMTASSRGAREAGGKTIGITTEVFKSKTPNEWIEIKSQTESYAERMMVLTSVADAFIALRGGIGTLTEMTLVWTLDSVGEIHKPIILVGDAWEKTIDGLSKHLLIRDSDKKVLTLVKTPEEALDVLNDLWSDK